MILELSGKCTKCGMRSSFDVDSDVPVKCHSCNGFLIIEDWIVLEEEEDD